MTRARVVFIPAPNPGGLAKRSRYNSRGVDLARNAPVDSPGPTPWLFGGHRLAPWLPGFRGKSGEPMQAEAHALVEFVLAQSSLRRRLVAVECESRAGRGDLLWFPHRHSSEPMPWLPLMMRLKNLLDAEMPAQAPSMAPRWLEGLAHGAMWDHVLLRARPLHIEEGRLALLTLSMGRRPWLSAPLPAAMRSNPSASAFHFRTRLAEVLMGAASSSPAWMDIDPSERSTLLSAALDAWSTGAAPRLS